MVHASASFFLVIEGLDGSGKTEISRRLVQVLQSTHKDQVKLTFEPHDPSCSGLFIRQVLMNRLKGVSPRTLALAFATNRADHCDREIDKYLKSGDKRIVLCDRYYLSSLVYQSTPELTLNDVMTLNAGARRPDLTIFLDASDRTCYERMRRRPEDKQLFEKNLRETRRKYGLAIEFLRERGETIVEVQADPSIDEVLDRILTVLAEHGPKWLITQRPISVATLPQVFSLNGTFDLRVEDVARDVAQHWRLLSLRSKRALLESIGAFRGEVDKLIEEMSYNDLGALFLDCIGQSGFRVLDRLPWTDLDAFELRYEMPLHATQRGTALLLGEAQRYAVIAKKVFDLEQLSDFMFILDPNPSHLVNSHYERDLVQYDSGTSLSPSTRVIERSDIARLVVASSLYMYLDEHYDTTSALGRKGMFFEVIRDLGLDWHWDKASPPSLEPTRM
jgi:dTMP kinase